MMVLGRSDAAFGHGVFLGENLVSHVIRYLYNSDAAKAQWEAFIFCKHVKEMEYKLYKNAV